LSRQGIFFALRSGRPEPGDFEMIQSILKRHNVPPQWTHLHCVG
jgi:hypothetical protein